MFLAGKERRVIRELESPMHDASGFLLFCTRESIVHSIVKEDEERYVQPIGNLQGDQLCPDPRYALSRSRHCACNFVKWLRLLGGHY